MSAIVISPNAVDWLGANQHFLYSAVETVQVALARYVAHDPASAESAARDRAARDRMHAAEFDMPAPPALAVLCDAFGLSSFERDLLLLCAGAELDSSFASLCAAVQSDAARPFPTFGVAIAALPDAHWIALAPSSPLRYWKLIHVGNGHSLVDSPLHIDESILHYLMGVPQMNLDLFEIAMPIHVRGTLVPSHAALAREIARTWSESETGALPVIQLVGDDRAAKQEIAAAACAAAGLTLSVVAAQHLPLAFGDLDALARICERESVLRGTTVLLDCDSLDDADAARDHAITRFTEDMNARLIIGSPHRRRPRDRAFTTIEVGLPTRGEQRAMWQAGLASTVPALDGQIDALATHYRFDARMIDTVCGILAREHRMLADESPDAVDRMRRTLWNACRTETRSGMDDLAHRIEVAAHWDDFVLPEAQKEILHEIAAHVRQRNIVYDTWGFANKGTRGLGVTALFAGDSGTGKTMAAEVLAGELHLDLYRIDLSAVVSKYIGETEKNLRRVFDTAEGGGAILLFDEADALFGKRSEVKDSHDRHANIEVSYLLQRMDEYRGLAILTSNLKSALDTAFLRRIRFVVHFPFPDAAHRAQIWSRVFPAETPTAGLDPQRLAQLNIAGGNIRSIAIRAAFLAADAGEPVRMTHILRAARSEYSKLEKRLTEGETVDWVADHA
ncbi:MAG: ATP-binding protein [Thermomicrobiales bacterium]